MRSKWGRVLLTSTLLLTLVQASARVEARTATPKCGPLRTDQPHPAKGYPNDPLYERQWNLQQIDAPEAWRMGATGRGAVIGVVDSGIDIAHADLRKKLVLPKGVSCKELRDELGHGTHVAGIAAASTDNGIGVAGVAPDAKILATPIHLDRAASIVLAVDSGADVINMSWLTFPLLPVDPLSPDIVEALNYAADKGVVLVAAAGNDRAPWCVNPASQPMVLCVAGTDRRGLPAHFSNRPIKASGPSVSAPAGVGIGGCDSREDIWSTMTPGAPYHSCDATPGYQPLHGTSMAAPHVAGVAALLIGLGYEAEDVKRCITESALNPLTGKRGEYDPVYGYGIVNGAAAVDTCRAS